MTRARKRYRPRQADPLAMWRAFRGSSVIDPAQSANQKRIIDAAIGEFACGRNCAAHWRTLADALNVAESLCEVGICSDDESRGRIMRAQQVLANVHERHAQRNSWTLHALELDTLREAAWLHHTQLTYATYAEFERAYQATERRIAQARAGNAPAGAIIVEGQIQ